MTKMLHIQNLLNQSEAIVKKYRQIAEISGENFNIFSILGLQSSETRLHSKLINELLNPKGKHGQKDLFLKLFIEVLNEKIRENLESEANGFTGVQIIDFKTEKASTGIEVYTGKINDEGTEGGRIDILINDNHSHGIIIENKIWASDQSNQLLRYHNYGKSKFKFHIIYLTVDGKIPSNYSTGGQSFDYLCISYKEDIIKWLELSRKECAQLPIIRETLTQYINQLKIYSGQSIHHKMKNEIIEVMSKNIDGSFEIANNLSLLKKHLMEKLKQEVEFFLKNEIERNHYEYKIQDGFTTGEKWKGISVYKKEWLDKNLVLRFSYEKDNFNGMIYGFARHDSNKGDGLIESEIHIQLMNENPPNAQNSKPWPLHFNFEPRDWENNREVWLNIENGEMVKEFKKCLQRLLDIANKLEL